VIGTNRNPGVYTCTVSASGTGGTPSAPAAVGTTQVTLTVNAMPFFAGAVDGGNGTKFLQTSGGKPFGYFGYLGNNNWMYHADLGYLYVISANDASNGIYMWDMKSGHWFYTSGATFPFMYDFTVNAWLYYFPSQTQSGHYTSSPRNFVNMTTNQFFSM
jgi:hypothetical protein